MARISFDDIDSLFIFRARPEAIPGDFRPLWRIFVILLILHLSSRGGKSTIGKLHVLNWAIRTKENRDIFRKIISGDIPPETIIIRIEPSLNRAINLAQGEGLVENVKGNRIRITPRGQKATDKLLAVENLFTYEKSFLEDLGKSTLTEQVIDNLLSNGS
jgi:hypothetical protein